MNDKQKNLSIKEALNLFHQDGIADIIAGATLINFGFDILNKAITTSLFTWLPIILLSSVKNRNTFPRIEPQLAEIDSKKRRIWTFIPALIMIIALLILGIISLGDSKQFFEGIIPASSGNLQSFAANFALALICLLTAIWVERKEFYIYSVVALVLGIASFFLPLGQFSMFINGVVMVGFGLRSMVRFSKQYPLPKETSSNED